ncbi:MAG: 4Fe-4S dicluster domain-containing protein [Nitrospirae bacterium]|nr:4Fe-4S dicluster domain-containing protein [Nitrospirota bacterium]MBF0542123.1 4Fe-4S dicluster domain-containing protein [Nitrospirota bacterium]
MANEQGRYDFLKEAFGSIFSVYSEFKAAASFKDDDIKVVRKSFRPPGAIAEAEFLKTCTRCDECIKACPENAIMKVIMLGSVLHLTPIINFREAPCRLCVDLPCTKSCSAGALVKVESVSDVKIGVARINRNLCYSWLGQDCEYCVSSCPLSGEAIAKNEEGKPVIDEAKCSGCGVCEFICPVRTSAVMVINLHEGSALNIYGLPQGNSFP